MSGVNLTAEQLAAVTARGGNLLVSAAAGSGKTRVLVERLLSRVEDENDLCDVDEFLIITYTKAAAAEMRGRIIEELGRRLALRPTDRHLRRQMTLVYRADITTVHAFCASMLRENAHLCGLNPDFRVCDETENELIKTKALDDLLEKKYAQIEDNSDFGKLVDAAFAGRDDRRLTQIVRDVHAKLQSHPFPKKWMNEQLLGFDESRITDAGQTIWGMEIMACAHSAVQHARQSLACALKLMDGIEPVYKSYGSCFEGDLDNAAALCRALETGWEEARGALEGISFARLGSVRAFEDIELLERIKAARENWKKTVLNLKSMLEASTQDCRDDMRALAPVARALFETVGEFDDACAAEKRRRNLCDFGDLEHFTVGLFTEDDGNGGLRAASLARRIGGRYREIMVDEYQDINEVQELIVSCLSEGRNNAFMVGDIKQSIYRFRLADPGIFLKKYKAYPDYDAESGATASKIILSRNFRSRARVLEAVNCVFESLMTEQAAEMDYTECERLNCGAGYDSPGEPVEFHLVNMNEVESGDEEETPEKAQAEAAFVADRIKTLLDGGILLDDGAGGKRPATPRDIAILMRSPGARAVYFERALSSAGIACHVDKGEGLLGTVEISVMLSVLSVIDNPRQDIPLISVLRSPLFGLSADELAEIRAGKEDGQFFDALEAAAAAGNEKCRGFLQTLSQLRFDAPDMSVDRLIWHIYNKTGMLGLFGAMPAGTMRRANLLKLVEYARGFEKTSFKGLFSFIGFIRRMMERGQDIGDAQGMSEDVNAVRIMSVHKSKGLEFPIVILTDCARQFNRDDLKKNVLLHKDLGPGFKRMDESHMAEYATLSRQAVSLRLTRELLAEEMRVLYVGMTRAREKLIITCAMNDVYKSVKSISMQSSTDKPSPYVVGNARSMAHWLILALLGRPEAYCLSHPDDAMPEEREAPLWDIRVTGALSLFDKPADMPSDVDADLPNTQLSGQLAGISRRLSFRYPYQSVVNTPSKLTATQIKGRFNDYETAEEAPAPPEAKALALPRFITGDTGLTPSEKGVAMHLAMQFVRFESCLSEQAAAAELERLYAMSLLTKEQTDAVDAKRIAAFLNNPLGQRLLAANNILREFKFSVLAPADQFAGLQGQEGEEVLLQGVIDCCFEDARGLTVLDFKTDRVTAQTQQERAESYRTQLETYAWALESILGKPVSERYVYFFSINSAISLE